MASVFKRGGKKNREGKYVASFFDENGKRISRSTGTTDYDAACQVAARWDTDVALRRHGVIDATQARVADQNRQHIREHVADYLAHCRHVGQDKAHIAIKTSQLAKLVAGINATRLSDLEPNRVERYLAGLVTAGRSHRTHNQNRATAVAFMQWCFEQGRVTSNLLKIVPTLNEAKDRRRVRRALTEDELSRLLAVSDERRPYYLFAYYTGLRVKAVKAAVWGDVDFDSALIRVKVGNAKGKKDDIHQPLHPRLLQELRRMKSELPFASQADPIFPGVPLVKTFHRDCQRSGIERYDADGRQLDRHALRTTLGTHLARAGVLPQLAMKVMGHNDVQTTMKHYTALRLADTAKAMNALPTIEPKADANPAALRATGTDAAIVPSNLSGSGAQHVRQQLCGSDTQNLTSTVADSETGKSSAQETATFISPRKNRGFGDIQPRATAFDLKEIAAGDTIEKVRAISSVGQSVRITPVRSQVRALYRPLNHLRRVSTLPASRRYSLHSISSGIPLPHVVRPLATRSF
jgi:integrase